MLNWSHNMPIICSFYVLCTECIKALTFTNSVQCCLCHINLTTLSCTACYSLTHLMLVTFNSGITAYSVWMCPFRNYLITSPNLLGPEWQQWWVKNKHFTVLLHLHYQYQLWSMETECTAEMSVSNLILMWLFKQSELPWLLCQEMLVPFEVVWQWQPNQNHSHNATIINITSTNIRHYRNVCFSNVRISYFVQQNTASLMQACHLYII
jgi:hypothetical protein